MSLRAALIWTNDYDEPGMEGEIELVSVIDILTMRAVKHAALRLAEMKIAGNIGDDVRELWFRSEYARLKETLDYVLPERREVRRDR